ncbi:hypothetical protein [Glutamicibacter mishrai]|uniref:Uncharacterized protein n=1 Tax=Glutamicibacter mishrai TaxID=1775880 RepID=A0A6H0SJA4_9MICC|nr:hypothetical protein [Glutamicibacter mishrai]QIV87478.1 hypothetical protein D3791_10315 [Glutamicibacter mishrai]
MEIVDALLQGQRGRRLLWEFAIASEGQNLATSDERPLLSAMFYASYSIESARGDGVVLFCGEQSDVPEVGPAGLARLLEGNELVPVTETLLQAALARSVDAARYWQEPDGHDTLLAAPELVRGLERVAQHISASSAAAQWAAAMDERAQFRIEFEEQDPVVVPQRTDRKAIDTLLRWKEQLIIAEARAAAERPVPVTAALSGEWWSVPDQLLPSSTGVFANKEPVGLSCVEDGFGWERASAKIMSVPPAANVLEISTAEDWIHLCREQGIDVTAQKRHDWYRVTGRDGAWKIPDWLAVARRYDGVHLSIAAYLALAGECLAVDEKFSTVIAGWDPDRTFWFTDALRFYGPAQEWTCLEANSEDSRWVSSGEASTS